MPKKKGPRNVSNSDFTINDSANAPMPVTRLKKSSSSTSTAPVEVSWDEIDTDAEIIEEVGEDGTKKFVSRKNNAITEDDLENRPGIVYPEIVFYLISRYIKPEQVRSFAGINRACYACTKRETFWRNLYNKYCYAPWVPEGLNIEYSFRAYGLRQRVIRALFHSYRVFTEEVNWEGAEDHEPHQLVGWHCVSLWYRQDLAGYWLMFFKLKKLSHQRQVVDVGRMIEELERIDANPEQDCRILQIICKNLHDVPCVMGMTLAKVHVTLSQGLRYRRVHLGFSTSAHKTLRHILPEKSVIMDTAVAILVYDWWHPRYPHYDNIVPSYLKDEESLPVLETDFFNIGDGEI